MALDFRQGLHKTFDRMVKLNARGDCADLAYWTGIDRLDWRYGLRPGELTVLAGAPSVGKTALAISLLLTKAKAGQAVLFFTYELTIPALTRRVLSAAAGVEGGKIASGLLTKADWERLTTAAKDLVDMPLAIEDDPDLNIDALTTKAHEHATACPDLRLIVVDYVQHMPGRDGGTRDQQIGEITRGLKATAKRLNVAVLALSQLNRGGVTREGQRPALTDLRDSSALAQDADNVWFLQPYGADDADGPTDYELVVAKQRNGECGFVDLRYTRATGHFAERKEAPPEETRPNA
jgi:replicative DNA helicase